MTPAHFRPKKSKSLSEKSSAQSEVSIERLKALRDEWILDARIHDLSGHTIRNRDNVTRQLIWYLDHRKFSVFGRSQIKEFLLYLSTGHNDEGGFWGNPAKKNPLKHSTIGIYTIIIFQFTKWLIEEKVIAHDVLGNLKSASIKEAEVVPFTTDQIERLLVSADRSSNPKRNRALVLFLYDTGVRRAELIGLNVKDIDFEAQTAVVNGKGRKVRVVPFGSVTAKALRVYLRSVPRKPEDPLFLSEYGKEEITRISEGAFRSVVNSLAKDAGITNMRHSPHIFRHSASITFLRNGGSVLTLQRLLGHRSLEMCKHYAAIADADVIEQHRQFSPSDRLKKKKR